MTWTGDPRTSTTAWAESGWTAPPGWDRTRAQVLKRDRHICHVCGKPGADAVDHVIPRAEGGSDDPSNLAAIHDRPCHRRKSSAEGNRARWQRAPKRRPPEQHPGVI